MTTPKRLQPKGTIPARWQISTYQAGAAEPRIPHPTDVPFGDGVVYERRSDRIVIETSPGNTITIAPGRRFAEAMARGFTAIPDLPAPTGERTTCETCGADILIVTDPDDYPVMIDPKPDKNGIWLHIAEGRVRSLVPMENPTAPTYATHRCRRKGTS